ncbi:peptide chain release factor N(5)-glutamine methyltransferase [Roseixanthobacter pseudopolyaromaticivorans]|uniref:peptide chain release factor N(5)-glutamine methyltransferase n=1 Tax=Xanthobacteraceae TaxID=335928 RepID=UPI003727B65F
MSRAASGAPTRAAVRRSLAARLLAAGMESADLDARLLLADALDVAPADLLLDGDLPMEAPALAAAEARILRRLAGEPVARILGEKEFWSLPFRLSDETLVPRPDTETLVEAALSALSGRREERLRVLDLGIGSGAILAALLSELPHAFGVGVDRSAGAASTARDNLARLGLAGRSVVRIGDWAQDLEGPFDLVVSNPPYIPSGDLPALEREVRLFDPARALDGGADGLDAYRAILAALPRLLAPDGLAVLELGIGQEDQVAALARAQGLVVEGPARADLGGIPRALVLRAA